MSGDRAAAPVVGKALEAAVLVVVTALLATTLFGGVLPDYRTATGAEVADRTLAGAADRIDRAVPDGDPRSVAVERRVPVPDAIRGRRYEVRATGRALVLDHPAARIDERTRLALPPGVRATGAWSSEATAVVRVEGRGGELRVLLVERSGGTG
ncbi:MAG: hypothetical protein ABEH40_08020 [Haloferacaceae archaeon]